MGAIAAFDQSVIAPIVGVHPAIRTCAEILVVWVAALIVVTLLAAYGANPAMATDLGALPIL